MSHEISKGQQDLYSKAFATHGASVEATFQNDADTQGVRFRRLVAQLDLSLPSVSILDVGCGFADLYGFLRDRGYQGTYAGIELVEGMAQVAQQRYPALDIRTADILSLDRKQSFDYVVQSGVFNIHGGVPPDEWRRYCTEIVGAMFLMCTTAIAFNALTTYSTFSDPELAYFETSFWEELVSRNHTRFFTIDHSYPLFEYTLTAFQPAHIQANFPSPALAKYFPSREVERRQSGFAQP